MKTCITSYKHILRYYLPFSLLLVMTLSGCNSEEKIEEAAEEVVGVFDSEGFCRESNELQLCVDEAIKQGTNTVLLKEQVYLLTETILLADNLKIEGLGSTSVVTWDESVKDTIDSPLFYTTTADNVELSNFKITGTINQDNDSKDFRNDHIGVFFECEGDPAAGDTLECNDITIKNLEVENCSHGIHIKGAQDITAIDLNLHNNGNTEVDLFHNIYYRRVSDVYMSQTDERLGGFYNSPRGHGIRATNLHHATFDNLQVYGNADHGVNFGEIYSTTFNYVDVYENCANPSGNCSQIQCYAEPCDLTIITDEEPVLTNITLTVNDANTIDISWNITGLPQEANKIELFRNTINAASGRSLIQGVEESGTLTDSSILVNTQYWYMFKIQFASGETLNSEITGPIVVNDAATQQ
jgi:predicted NUDIX family phosphoesterase